MERVWCWSAEEGDRGSEGRRSHNREGNWRSGRCKAKTWVVAPVREIKSEGRLCFDGWKRNRRWGTVGKEE